MGELHRFLFDGLPVRGQLVRLGASWREMLSRRAGSPYPLPVRVLLGEMAAASVLMQSNIKFNGALVLQVFGDGPVKLAVAEAQADLSYRATAKVVGEVPPDARLEALLNVHGQGRCAITLDPIDKLPGQQPYQGVVPLHGDRREPLQQLSQVLEHYMLQSEQLDTRLVLAADDQMAAGLLLQRMPVEGPSRMSGER
ncbi:MAG: Hsp33 family molecular chaperone HslO, partial [Rubrivivax sp.]